MWVFLASVVLTCTAPTQNTDGSPLTDLTSYDVLSGCNTSGVYERPIQVFQGAACGFTVTGLPNSGTCYFVARAVNSKGLASDNSNEAVKFLGTLQPPGPVLDTAVTWQPSPKNIYELPYTDFTGNHVVAGNWSIPGESLLIDMNISVRSVAPPWYDNRIFTKSDGDSEAFYDFSATMWSVSQVIRFRLKTSGVTTTLTGLTTVLLNTLTNVKLTYDGSKMCILINDIKDICTGKTGTMDQSSKEVWVGSNAANDYQPFDGFISVTVK